MNGDDFLTTLQYRLGKRTDFTAAMVLLEAEMVRKNILEAATFKPWFLQAEDTSISTTASQEYISRPTDFLHFDAEDDWCQIAYNDPDDTSGDPWVPIVLDDWNVIRTFYRTKSTEAADLSGKPEKGALVFNRLYMRPIPDAVYSTRWRYYKTDTAFDFTVASENLWLQHASDWVMGEVGFIFASQYVRDADVVGTFALMKQEGRKRVYNETIARFEAGKMRSMGDD